MDLVTGVLGSVIPKLSELLKDEYKLQTSVKKKIQSLSRDLESMHAALRKVAQVPTEELDEPTRLWARDVRELSYDVDDILDTFLVCIDGRKARDPNRFKRAAKKIGKLFSRTKACHQIAGMIESINEQAEEIASRHVKYKVDEIVSKATARRTVDPRIQVMWKKVTELVGIEKPIHELISKLSPLGDDEMKMLSVVGAGGLGKTTLAKAVYDKLKVDFECTAFVAVGRDPDLKKVFRDILIDLDKKKFMDPKYDLLDGNRLIMELREYLKDRRYFIVIDDIWNIDTWKRIMYALVQNNNGSRVITTTRHRDVADQAGEVYRLAPLPRDQSEKLFYTRVFGAKETCPNNQLKEVADKILNKCHDVPLAVITMASLLVGKTQGEWIEVCNSVVFGGKKKNQEVSIVSDTEWILSLSYYDLPPHLKSCLLYLSAYPEDYLIKKDHLIWMWVAEGFIVDKEPGTGFFEVGEGYFNELINRSMIQAVQSESNYGIIDACRIHDMVLDLIRVKSQEENFFTILRTNAEDTSSTCRVRRLSCQTDEWVEPTCLDITQMRTFISFVDCLDMDLQRLKLLRVLYLKDSQEEVHIENLLHLRYLRVEGYTAFEIQSIGALKFLQILDLEDKGIEELPSSLGLLTQLICLRARRITAGYLTVPNGIIEKLTSLEELRIKFVKDDRMGQFVIDLGNLLELRVLRAGVDLSESIVESNLVETLGKLHKLQHLKVGKKRMYEPRANEAIWNAAVLPRSLQHFIIMGLELPVLPSCINPSGLPNLTRLELMFVSFMDEESLRILGGLPELRHLKLYLRSTLTVNVHADDDGFFQKLISLSMYDSTVHFALNEDNTISFTIWNGMDDVAFGSAVKGEDCIVRAPGVMPNLQLLEFMVKVMVLVNIKGRCDRLGLQYLPSLQKAKVHFWCRDAFEDDVEREKAALSHAIEAHPNHPTFETRLYGELYTFSCRPVPRRHPNRSTLKTDLYGIHDMEGGGCFRPFKPLYRWEVDSWTDDEDVPEKEEATNGQLHNPSNSSLHPHSDITCCLKQSL